LRLRTAVRGRAAGGQGLAPGRSSRLLRGSNGAPSGCIRHDRGVGFTPDEDSGLPGRGDDVPSLLYTAAGAAAASHRVSLMAGEIGSARGARAEAPVVRVFVAAHVRLYREALAEILAREEGLEIVGACGDREEILARVAELGPDVVLLDPAAAESIALIRELAALVVGVKVVALASSEAESEVIAYAEAGVSGFVTCEESTADLVATIVRAAHGDLVCSPQLAGSLLRRVTSLAAEPPEASRAEPLTARELEVARLLDEGLSNQQIALRLQLELPTVKHHVHHILHKLAVASRGEAVARLHQRGLLAATRGAAPEPARD